MSSTYRPKTKPFAHQMAMRTKAKTCLSKGAYFAYLCEQGTGKTKAAVDDAAELFEQGLIDAVIIAAPSEGDVPANWLDQFTEHLPDRIPRVMHRLEAREETKALKLTLLDFFDKKDAGGSRRAGDPLRVLSTNAEMLRRGSRYFKHILDLLRRRPCMLILDESTDYGSPAAEQTKGALKLGANAAYRRILTGTLTPNGPFNAYSQMLFLHKDILGYDNYTAFKSHYCEMLPPTNNLVKHIAGTKAANIRDPARRIDFTNRMASIIQIPAKGPNGLPIYKNLDELNQKIEKYSYRVLKKDCTDLPDKLYAPKLYVDLTPKQQQIYDTVKREVIAEFVVKGKLKVMTIGMQMIRLLRLQQIVGNHFMEDPDPDALRRDHKVQVIEPGDHPRVLALESIIKGAEPDAKGIIWCRFVAEIEEIVGRLRVAHGHGKVVEMHGKIKNDERVIARKRFLDPKDEAQWIVVQSSASKGYELTSASWECFYSNSYSLLDRLQAEDRAHRIGRAKGANLTIFDIIARYTQDEKIVTSLRGKKDIADVIAGDPIRNWI